MRPSRRSVIDGDIVSACLALRRPMRRVLLLDPRLSRSTRHDSDAADDGCCTGSERDEEWSWRAGATDDRRCQKTHAADADSKRAEDDQHDPATLLRAAVRRTHEEIELAGWVIGDVIGNRLLVFTDLDLELPTRSHIGDAVFESPEPEGTPHSPGVSPRLGQLRACADEQELTIEVGRLDANAQPVALRMGVDA